MGALIHIANLHLHITTDDKTLNEVKELLITNNKNQLKMANELETLTTEVGETKTVMASAVTLLQGLKAKLDAAGTDPAKLKALSDDLDSNTNALAEAITANTPAEGV